ncbi:MAG: phosphatidylglycerol lysyltransferase domain-containing protein [Clostridium sp.]|nr:phosphatidylglycerol lysyltransferase domain-containing protein [Clostridium sp.]
MLSFNKPKIEDKLWVDECFKYANSYNCEYTFGNLFVWATAYRTEIAHYKDFMICRWGRQGEYKYSLPIGQGDFKSAVDEIIDDAENNHIQLEIYGVTSNYKYLLEEFYPNQFSYQYDEGNFDYIYSVEKMAQLKGKKYHGKRNHITNFKKNNPNWSFEEISSSNINDCIELHTKWIENHDEDSDYSFEFEAVLTAFENYEKLGFAGGLLKIDGKAVAYTMGERQSDDLFVTHFEKAPADIQGAYPIINQEFTRNCLMGYKFVNREEDLGLEGLRKAKMSYNPEILLEKGVAIYNG